MHRAITLYFAGLTCGLFAATWNAQPTATQPTAIAQAALAQVPAPAGDKPAESDRQRLERKVHKLLKDNGTENVQKRSMESMRAQFEKMHLPPEFGDKFMARFDFDHVMDLAAKAYADHLDEATIDALAAFYQTPGGRKLAEATPDITADLNASTREYGEKLAREVGAELGK
jgi:hypothetical protein